MAVVPAGVLLETLAVQVLALAVIMAVPAEPGQQIKVITADRELVVLRELVAAVVVLAKWDTLMVSVMVVTVLLLRLRVRR